MNLYMKLVKDLDAKGIDVVIRATTTDVKVTLQDKMTKGVILSTNGETVEGALSDALTSIATRATNSVMLSVL